MTRFGIFTVAAIAMNGFFVWQDPSRWWAIAAIGFHAGLMVAGVIAVTAIKRWAA